MTDADDISDERIADALTETPAQRVFTSDDWATPPEVIAVLNTLGGVGLDPCSNEWSIVNARHTYDLRRGQDGLVLPWNGFGLTFANPPYSKPLPWMKRAAEGEGDEVLLLVAYDATRAWRHFGWTADAVVMIDHRLKFIGPQKFTARFPSALIYWGERVEELREAATPLGKTLIQP